jgi:hypothetical protein
MEEIKNLNQKHVTYIKEKGAIRREWKNWEAEMHDVE